MKKFFTGICLGTATALASVIGATPARAVDCFIGFDPVGGTAACSTFDANNPIREGDKAWYYIEESGDWGSSAGLLDFREISGVHEVAIEFFHTENGNIVDGTNPLTGFNGDLEFGIDILGSNTFESVSLGTLGEPLSGPYEVTKTVDGVVLSVVGSGTDGPEAVGGTSLTVLDEFSVPVDSLLIGSVNEFAQTSAVPGPLPILGAGAAFGYSRRIRSRIRKAAAV